MLEVLRNRLYRIFFYSFTLGNFAEGLLVVTTPFLILRTTGRPADVGIGLAAQTIGVLCALLPGGTLADRFSKIKIISLSYILGALSLLPVFLLNSVQNNIVLLALCLFMFGVSTAIYGPISDSLTPDLVDESNLHRANSVESFSQRVGQGMAGPVAGGILIALDMGTISYAIASMSLLLAAVSIRRINIPTLNTRDEDGQGPSWSSALRFLRKWPSFTLLLVWVSVAVMLQMGAKPVVNTTWADGYQGGSMIYGSALAIGAVASLATSVIVGNARLPKNYVLCMILCWSIGSSAVIILLFNKSATAFAVTFIVSSIFLTIGNIYWSTFMQKSIPRALLPRMLSIDWFASLALVPLGAALAGFGLERIGLEKMFLVLSTPILFSGFIMMILMRRSFALRE
ncbi:hypothetical protein HMPREF3160_01030 [Arthrobacter sp. HMSC06H05]|uniref:Major facilitator superfamily (MFS) profile domain-containing protein n=1 Tax=Pseudoglutamicibacter albus DNF00011 TaxID=1401063 RepID=A0A095YGQ2_9MICC|nr:MULTISPECIES: MFS transporter [Micrococcaceae]KGF21605.1 hypothetical protein HMPREF2128_00495 [Pseudoglutamicibacter albus DNF00011]OFT44138.1 hypothetical protein HMPREF3160_01030 [Arthrobacter sp. HMSC06H05]